MPLPRTDLFQCSSVWGALWNYLPLSIKPLNDHRAFKGAFRKHLMDIYAIDYYLHWKTMVCSSFSVVHRSSDVLLYIIYHSIQTLFSWQWTPPPLSLHSGDMYLLICIICCICDFRSFSCVACLLICPEGWLSTSRPTLLYWSGTLVNKNINNRSFQLIISPSIYLCNHKNKQSFVLTDYLSIYLSL